jgi:hemerythrin HHE cation binding domain-containing protein
VKVTVLLGDDQRKLRQLIEQFRNFTVEDSDSASLQELGQQIRRQMHLHSQMASEVFYPSFETMPSDPAASFTATAENRCAVVEKLLQELSRMKPTDDDFEVKVDTVISEIGRHVAMQEDELLHEARKTYLEFLLEDPGLETPDRFITMKMIAVL